MKRELKRAGEALRPEYDFASMQGGVRGKYASRLGHGTNIVVLEDDVAVAFPTDNAVNGALRAVLEAAALISRGKKARNPPLRPAGSARS